MTVVMMMSTDPDIIATGLNPAWNPIAHRYSWAQVSAMNLNIAAPVRIVVLAHGNGNAIGNKDDSLDIDAETFLALIQGNMAAGATPSAIYISTCGEGIAEFAAAVRIAAKNNQIWNTTRIFGHSEPVAGPVPPPHDTTSWVEIYSGR